MSYKIEKDLTSVFNVDLSIHNLLMLDGLANKEIQDQIDFLKQAMAISNQHFIPLNKALFVQQVIKQASEDGELVYNRTELNFCPITGQQAELVTPARATRDNPYCTPRLVSFYGISLGKRYVAKSGNPQLSVSQQGLIEIKPVLVERLKGVKAQISKYITGFEPEYLKFPIVKHETCGWEGREEQTKLLNTFTYADTCPCCNAESTNKYHSIFKTTEKWEVISQIDLNQEIKEKKEFREQNLKNHYEQSSKYKGLGR